MQRRAFLHAATWSTALAGPSVSTQNSEAKSKWNILVLVSDTLRQDYLEPYGNTWVRTPHLARLAQESAVFENARPESLPTIPTRRTLHSGRRAFPFRNYQPLPWDNVYLPGWMPMSSQEDTVAEALGRAGYICGFVSDVPHYFVPGMNFTRGFHQWEFIRGAAEDRYRSPAPYDQARIQAKYVGRGPMHVANLGGFEPDEMAFTTPRTISAAMRFLEENRENQQPFYLYVDTFPPHESWEAPRQYYQLYRDPAYQGKTYLSLPYDTLFQTPVPEAAVKNAQAHYAGLITMVDHWIGKLLGKLEELGKDRSTLMFFLSDHGTNFGDNPERVTGKPAGALYPGTMNIPLLVRHPERKSGGKRFQQRVSTLDLPASVCAAAGVSPREGLHGKNLLPLLEGEAFSGREYQTCRYSNCVWYADSRIWYFSTIHWQNIRLFDLEASHPFRENIAPKAADRVALAQRRILEDAGGALPAYPLTASDRVKAPFI
ncbi:MAG: sulfatase [Bryobacteraceae bacterium]|nr:sulfatase [Bryobacteraceae bacterium]MDW8378974.1 sulfatase [Bryobacterales bacterium]